MKDFDETRDRFIAAIADKVPADRVVEVHLFHPMRQAGMQSGVAVVALREPEGSEDRLGVYTATYRLTEKGPERGKWDFAIQAEADAPLVTVDQVVRGVQRRAGDTTDPLRVTAEEFRAMLPPPAEGSGL